MPMNSVSCITTVSVGDDVVSYKGYQVKHIAAESRDCETLFVHLAIDIVVKKSDATVDSELLHVSASNDQYINCRAGFGMNSLRQGIPRITL